MAIIKAREAEEKFDTTLLPDLSRIQQDLSGDRTPICGRWIEEVNPYNFMAHTIQQLPAP